jgi:perosamine synthetase
MVVTGDAQLAERLRELRGKRSDAPGDGHSPPVRLNARMTNLSAALGLSQLRKADFLIETRRRIAGWYRSELDGVAKISTRTESTTSRSVYWLFSVRFLPAEKNPLLRESLRSRLKEDGIETRPFYRPLHSFSAWRRFVDLTQSERLAFSGLNLPMYPRLTREDVSFIAGRLRHHVAALTAGGAGDLS